MKCVTRSLEPLLRKKTRDEGRETGIRMPRSGKHPEGAICITACKRTEFAQLAERKAPMNMRLEGATAK